MKQRFQFLFAVVSFSLSIVPALASENPSLFPEVLALGTTRGGVQGGELGVAVLNRPFSDHALFVGPRVLLSTPFDLALGAESTLWFVNAIGPGVAADYLLQDRKIRLELHLGIRFLHLGDDAALSFRAGIFHESQKETGLKAGVTLQFGGINSIGSIP